MSTIRMTSRELRMLVRETVRQTLNETLESAYGNESIDEGFLGQARRAITGGQTSKMNKKIEALRPKMLDARDLVDTELRDAYKKNKKQGQNPAAAMNAAIATVTQNGKNKKNEDLLKFAALFEMNPDYRPPNEELDIQLFNSSVGALARGMSEKAKEIASKYNEAYESENPGKDWSRSAWQLAVFDLMSGKKTD